MPYTLDLASDGNCGLWEGVHLIGTVGFETELLYSHGCLAQVCLCASLCIHLHEPVIVYSQLCQQHFCTVRFNNYNASPAGQALLSALHSCREREKHRVEIIDLRAAEEGQTISAVYILQRQMGLGHIQLIHLSV